MTDRDDQITRDDSSQQLPICLFNKSGRGSGNFLNHYNAHRFFDASLLERATISLVSPCTLLIIIKAYTNKYAQMDKKKVRRVDVRFILRKRFRALLRTKNSVDIYLLVALSAKIQLYVSFARTKIQLYTSAYGAGGGAGGCSPPPSRGKNSIISGKTDGPFGRKETVKNILLFNILIYLFSPRNSPNLLKLPPSRR